MNKLLQKLVVFNKKNETALSEKEKFALDTISQSANKFKEFIANSEGFFVSAELDQISDLNNPTKNTIPPYFKFGDIVLDSDKKFGNIRLPLLLPFTNSNAVLFDLEHSAKQDIPNFLQFIAMHFLLSVQMKLCKFYFIDADFGKSFTKFSNINNSSLKRENFYRREDINKLMTDLPNIVSQAYQSYLASYASLTDYNRQAGQLAEPYHIVFRGLLFLRFLRFATLIYVKSIKASKNCAANIYYFFT